MKDHRALAAEVLEALESYQAPSSPDHRFGSARDASWIKANLTLMRQALVHPHPTTITDDFGNKRQAIAVVDDKAGSMIVYDPIDEGDFALALGDADLSVLAGPRGDPVGCFLAR